MNLAELLGVMKEKEQACSTCKETKPESEYHRRKDRKGNVVRRRQCRSCVAKKQGKPGIKVRPS